jgi:hypothetical protein
VRSNEGEAPVIQEVARLERGPLRPETLGLSWAEARAILASLEQLWWSSRSSNLSPKNGHAPAVADNARAKLTTES